jgi:osmotically-inducible protein OsmY
MIIGNEGGDNNESKKDYYAGYYFGNDPYSSNSLEEGHDDETLTRKIEQSLKSNVVTKSCDIKVTVVDGLVTLHGSVRTLEQKREAAKIAWTVSGIVEVLDELKVLEPERAGL